MTKIIAMTIIAKKTQHEKILNYSMTNIFFPLISLMGKNIIHSFTELNVQIL